MSNINSSDDERTDRSNKLRSVTRHVIWARGAGRCHICNGDLIGDLLSGADDANFGFIAHIVADRPTGPRGDPGRSWDLADDPENLMLLCYTHHKMVDRDKLDEYPEERLQEIKRAHEARVSVQTGIRPERATHVLRYAANVGQHRILMPYQDVAKALLPDRYPADGKSMIDIFLSGSAREDGECEYWDAEATNLTRQYTTRVRERIDGGEVHHLSVFAIAPQPLLILLGTLIGDITPASVLQRHREPETWGWPADGPEMPLEVHEAAATAGPIALKIALSATVDDERIRAVLGPNAAIWSVTTPNPHNDVLKRSADLQAFRQTMRALYDRIKAHHGSGNPINIFPAMPVAAAVETGRVWMPKADLQLITWDENRALGGFRQAITIGISR